MLVDQFKQTSVRGIFAAGRRCAVRPPQVSIAAASGPFAGVATIQNLQAEDFGLQLPPAMLDE